MEAATKAHFDKNYQTHLQHFIAWCVVRSTSIITAFNVLP